MSAQVHWTKHAVCNGGVVIIGFGSIASSLLPVLLRHIEVGQKDVTVVCPPGNDTAIARECGVSVVEAALCEDNFEALLASYVTKDTLLLNLSVNVSSESLVRFCWSRDALYLDTSIEPWEGGSTDPNRSPSRRSNYALREALLAFRLDKRDGPTTIVTQGANPGLASGFVKQALFDMAAGSGLQPSALESYEDWAALAQRLAIKSIHVAEQDSQFSERRKARNEFVNTWSRCLRRRRHAAGGTRLGHAWRVDLHRGPPDVARGRRGRLSADRPLRVPAMRRRDVVDRRIRRAGLAFAGQQTHHARRNRRRRRRTRRAADG
ncbi:MAG: Homospermidine synthase (EC [uncultured Paraburkholderia sp.]|nr:MAG: Homospermidine synthase (EC [uncultured Paraburkholderia sp.]